MTGTPPAAASTFGDDVFRLIFDHTHHFLGLLDLSGTVLEINRSVLEVGGVDRERLVGRPLWRYTVWPAAERARLRAAVARAACGERVWYEAELRRTKTQKLTLDFSLRPVRDAGGCTRYLLAEAHNSSARKRAELALAEQQVFLQAVLDNIADGVAACNAEGVLTVFNPATRAFHNLLEAPLPTSEWAGHYGLYRPDGKTPLRAAEVPLYRALRGEEVRDVEMVIAPEGGARRRILANGRALKGSRGEHLGAVVAMRDITATRAAERALRESEAQHRAVIDVLSEGIVQHARDGHITMCNPAAERLLGLSRAQLLHTEPVGARWRLVREDGTPLAPEQQPAMVALRSGEAQEGVVLGVHKLNGTLSWILVNCQPLWRLGEGEPYAVVSSLTDITYMKQTEAQLRHASLHDPLTGLPLRTLFQDRLERAVAYTERDPNFRFAVLYVDLDGFKAVNDTLGHGIGDNLLVTVARQLERCVRGSDTVARLGGDEFAVLFEHLAHIKDATQLAERVLRDLAISFNVAGREVSVSASIGIALSEQQRHARDLLHAADSAMYQAKAAGKAQYRVFGEPQG
jgi:diguanylate cyclase